MTWDDGEPMLERVFSAKLEALLGPARTRDEPVTARHEAIAASLQVVFEDAAFHVLNGLHARDAVVAPLSGRRLRDEQRGQRQDPRADAVQGGLHPAGVRRQRHGARRGLLGLEPGARPSRARFVMRHGYWGPAFDDRRDRRRRSAIARSTTSTRRGCQIVHVRRARRRVRLDGASASPTARSSAGSRAAWSGARGRSATAASWPTRAAPTCARSSTRRSSSARSSGPFAPSVLEEAHGEYFVGSVPDPFMMQVYPVRAEKQAVIPAVTHVDGSGRLQTVNREGEPALLGADSRVRARNRRAGRPEHVVQRERADRAPAGRGARLLPAHADGRAGARRHRDHQGKCVADIGHGDGRRAEAGWRLLTREKARWTGVAHGHWSPAARRSSARTWSTRSSSDGRHGARRRQPEQRQARRTSGRTSMPDASSSSRPI